ncbi:MAG: hypothetical protein II920_09695 [Clostridia bacterium]|nr:hypothetical protein [Clostridia bacterium]
MGDLFSHPSEGKGAAFDQSGWIRAKKGARQVVTGELKVSENGVYRVRVTLEGGGVLFGQRRNLVNPDAPAGESTFYTCLTEYMPSMSRDRDPGRALYASCFGGRILSMSAEKAEARRVFIAGDSTVADQYCLSEYYPFDSYCGWGQMLSAFLPDDAVCNMAHSGLTGRCFLEDGHFDIIKGYVKAGDLMLMQFGHNDQKRRLLQADRKYTYYLERLIDFALEKGAVPVLVSPVSRVPSKDAAGTFDLLEAHAEAVRALALRRGLPFIDLHTFTYDMYLSMGEGCRDLFKDMTHANDPGAFTIARHVSQRLNELGLARSVDRSAGFISSDREKSPIAGAPSPLPVPYVDIDGVKDKSVIDRAMQAGLLDPCVLHLHPFEPLSRAQFIQLLFRATGTQGMPTDGRAPYKDVKPREFDAGYAAACKKLGLVDGEYYRPDDDVTKDEINELSSRLSCQSRLEGDAVPTKYDILTFLLSVKNEKAKK